MIRRDYLQRQIDQLGKALGKLISDLAGLKNTGHASQGIEVTNRELKTQLDLDVEKLLAIPPDKFTETLQKQYDLTDSHLEQLAEVLFLLAEKEPLEDRRRNLFQRCLVIYTCLDHDSSTYSLERYFKIEQIKRELEL